ncbi:MAG: hypothetical protein ABH986_00610 [archaeon]
MKKPVRRKTYTDRLFRRFSQIAGVPVKNLMPRKYKNFVNYFGYYDPASHAVHLTGNQKLDEHEIRHGLQNLIMFPDGNRYQKNPKIEKQKIKERRKMRSNFTEPTNASPEETADTAINRSLHLDSKKEGYASTLQLIKSHGEDATLLLWASPPEKRTATQIPAWEKEMMQKGYLKPEGGMTKKGLQYFRRKLQTATVWKRLKEIEETRIQETRRRIEKKQKR